MYYQSVFEALNAKGVKYIVIGGLAINLHGIYRPTFDLDVMIGLDPENTERFVQAMEEIGYKPKIPVDARQFTDGTKREEWKREKGMVVFSFFDPDRPYKIIDVMIEEQIKFATAYLRRIEVEARNTTIPVAAIEDLIRLKRIADREQDRLDIRELETIIETDANNSGERP